MAQNRTRILIGAGSFADAASALRIAGRLSENMKADLGGLLIRDVDVLATYGRQNQRVIMASGTVIMAPSTAQIHTLTKADANAFRTTLARIAQSPYQEWTFEQQTGDLIECSIKGGLGWDVVIVGYREIHPVRGDVVFLGSQYSNEDPALEMSQTLATQLGARMTILSIGDADTFDARNREYTFDTLGKALSHLMRTNAQTVVIDLERGPIRSREQLRTLLDIARCPVVVLGAASLDTKLEYSTIIPPAASQ